jgi:putative two-component system response regulator
MKDHVHIGAQTLDQVLELSPSAGFLKMAAIIAREHHERFDGTGYPTGLEGQQISLAARIVALADVYDALTSQRCYKQAYDPPEAYEMILAECGRHFDPVVVDAFCEVFESFLRVPEDEGTEEPAETVRFQLSGFQQAWA